MANWSREEVQTRFAELLATCQKEGPQIVTENGVATAVLVPIESWQPRPTGGPTLYELLTADEPRFDLDIPDRHGRSPKT